MLSRHSDAANTVRLRRNHRLLGQPETTTATAMTHTATHPHSCHGAGSLAIPRCPMYQRANHAAATPSAAIGADHLANQRRERPATAATTARTAAASTAAGSHPCISDAAAAACAPVMRVRRRHRCRPGPSALPPVPPEGVPYYVAV